MDNPTGKWIPLNLDGTAHECKKSSQSQTQTQPQKEVQEQQNKSTLTLEEINKRLKKIEHTLYGTN